MSKKELDLSAYVIVGRLSSELSQDWAIAYWKKSERDHRISEIHHALKQIANLAGFDLVKRPTEQPQQIAAE